MQYGDPRVLRTQQLLKEALLELLLEGNQLHQLSVQKVTKHAKLNRTTFYLHYKDLEDLQVQMTQEILQQLTVKINALMHEKIARAKSRSWIYCITCRNVGRLL